MNNSNNTVALEAISGHSLLTMNIQPIRYCIENILPQGIAMLSGSPKTGKSWLVLEWCIRIAAGEPIWNFNTTKGTTLYLCLEDSWSRVQTRISNITRDVPQNVFFAVASRSISDGLTEQIESFVTDHPDTVLVAIDTFQMIRKTTGDRSYSNDYQVISHLKELADRLQITILSCIISENTALLTLSTWFPARPASSVRSTLRSFLKKRTGELLTPD